MQLHRNFMCTLGPPINLSRYTVKCVYVCCLFSKFEYVYIDSHSVCGAFFICTFHVRWFDFGTVPCMVWFVYVIVYFVKIYQLQS